MKLTSKKRKFRSDESLEAEELTRGKVSQTLAMRGFQAMKETRTIRGTAVTQKISATAPDGSNLKIHVRLCWRRGRNPARDHKFSAAQLRARLRNGSWEDTLAFLEAQDKKDGITHTLIAQWDGDNFAHAALIPTKAIASIWKRQREVSASLIERGLMGNVRKNHAANGSSPTMWLQDDRTPSAHKVSDVLWKWPGVINVLALSPLQEFSNPVDDTLDDLPVDYSEIGRDKGKKVIRPRSGYPRNKQVRTIVLARANGRCERESCTEHRSFLGFLDVHHILGVGKSDRVFNCVALCPNCHREAHFAPDRDAINAALQKFAAAWK